MTRQKMSYFPGSKQAWVRGSRFAWCELLAGDAHFLAKPSSVQALASKV